MAEFELGVHHKQGGDFHHFLERANGNVPKALRKWSVCLVRRATELVTVSDALEGDPEISAEADTHYIGIRATEKTKQKIKDLKLSVYREPFVPPQDEL